MRVAYIVTKADPIGGAQIHVRDLATAMVDQGHSALVITSGTGPFIDELRARNIPVAVLRNLGVPIHPFRDLRALREIRRALTELPPDLIAAHSSKAGVLGRLAGRALKVPVVFTVHGWAFTPGIPARRAALYRRIERAAGPFSSRIITVSEFDRRLGLEAEIAGPDRIVTVHNGIPDIAPALRADPARAPARLVMVARFGPQKDHATLLRALAGLQEHAWELELVGEGSGMAQTAALAGSLGLGGRVLFRGQRMDVDQILSSAQISLLVSNYEGFPLSILEAMRAGLPVVASAVGGVDESVHDGKTGFLVPRGDVDALRDRIGRLLVDPSLRMMLGARGRAEYERRFTLDQMVGRTLAVYRDGLR